MDHKYAIVRSPAHITRYFDERVLGLVFKKVRIPGTHSITFKMIITFPTFFHEDHHTASVSQPFLCGYTHFDNKKICDPTSLSKPSKSPKLTRELSWTKIWKLKLWDTLEETCNTQMCRDTMVENHCSMQPKYQFIFIRKLSRRL